MSFRPTSTSGSVSARCAAMAHQRAAGALRVVVLGLGKAVVDEEDRAAREAVGERGDERLRLRVQLGRAAGGKRRRRAAVAPSSADRPGERAAVARARRRARARRAVEVEQLDRHRVEHLVADDDAAHRLGQRVEPAHAVAERARRLALALAQRRRQLDDRVAAHAIAERAEQLGRERAAAGAELPDLVAAAAPRAPARAGAPARGRTAATARAR